MATATVQQQARSRTISLAAVAIGCAALTAVFAAIILKTVFSTGHWYYPLDDTYIDMSIAKHLALHGVWGTSSQFASAASSPGYICLLAICYRIFGVSQYTPLVLAFAASIGVVFVTARILRGTSPRVQVVGVLLVVTLTPLWTMAALGMEHALQILLCLIFLDFIIPVIASRERLNWKILLITAVMCSVRYECLFVVAGAWLLLLPKRWKASIVLACAGWFPVAAFGLYFRLHGAHWLPNSLLLKGGAGVARIFGFMERGLYLAPLMFLITWLAWRNRRANSTAKVATGITAVAMWLHLCFADYGWCYRYEAYLIALALVSLTLCYKEGILPTAMRYVALLAVGILSVHALLATTTLPGRSRAIYMQQIQTAKLLQLYPVPAALNDIGAPTYFTDTPVLDLVGLGSQDVFHTRYKAPYTTSALQRLLVAHHIQTIAIYDTWFSDHPADRVGGPPIPPNYVRIARLYTPAPAGYVGNDTVSYYAVRGTDAKLLSALEKLAASLPSDDRLTFE